MVLKNVIKYFTGLLGFVLLVYLFLFFAYEAAKVRIWQKSGTVESAVRIVEDSVLVLRRVDVNDFLSRPFPAVGDTIKTLNDSTATIGRWSDDLHAAKPPWRVVPIEFTHDGQVHRTLIWTRVPSYEEFVLVSVLQVLRFLITREDE